MWNSPELPHQNLPALVTVGHSFNTLATRWCQLSQLAKALPESPASVTEKIRLLVCLTQKYPTTSALALLFQDQEFGSSS